MYEQLIIYALTWLRVVFALVCFCTQGRQSHKYINLPLKVYIIATVILIAHVMKIFVWEFKLYKLSSMSLVQFFRLGDKCYSYNFASIDLTVQCY